ncbi:hypothetical protein XELAEV_18039162mg [Xenopus laevis]|uniref:Uncharacterized protein n=1 Tax=Xenopus laevis TaxID=8355 RepID=A0A974H837_XENLA|nr:hypothetical protein XELAEV_18039162mg [Xenopus laevis]
MRGEEEEKGAESSPVKSSCVLRSGRKKDGAALAPPPSLSAPLTSNPDESSPSSSAIQTRDSVPY